MRKLLIERSGAPLRVTAKIEKYAHRIADTYLLVDIKDANGSPLCDHLWIEIGPWAEGFRVGDVIAFTADVSVYVKGGFSRDLCLVCPREANIIAFGPITRMMADGSIKP